MGAKAEFLTVGDVVQADVSWCITDMSEDNRTVTVNQSEKSVYVDTGKDVKYPQKAKDRHRETKTVIDFEGPLVNNFLYYKQTDEDGEHERVELEYRAYAFCSNGSSG